MLNTSSNLVKIYQYNIIENNLFYVKYFSHRLNNDKLISYWKDKRYKNAQYKSYKLKKRFFDRLAANFKKKKQTVVFGNYKNIKNLKFGKKLPPIKECIKKCLNNKVDIKMQDEYNTSKKCYDCNDVLRNYNALDKTAEVYINAKESKFSNLKYCERDEFIIDRDVNAAINMTLIYDHRLNNNDNVPKAFKR